MPPLGPGAAAADELICGGYRVVRSGSTPGLVALCGGSPLILAQTMSKLSFRARALDAAKPLPVFLNRDLPDLSDCLSISRAVPQMPTGMEKEEELVGTCLNSRRACGG